jgi:OFA family oxalate/formate antiporter-like MFS transporter
MVASLLLVKPGKHEHLPAPHVAQTTSSFRPGEVLRSPLFWLLYVMSVLVTGAGLTFTAHLASMATDFKIAEVPVTLAGMTLPALTFALTLDRIAIGIARPLCGWLSDFIGRENAMFFAFTLGAVSIWAFSRWGAQPVSFVILASVVFFAWGEVASLFPSACTDYFGTGYATTNAGMLHTAKGVAALVIPFSEPLVEATGSWQVVFLAAVAMNAVAALLAIAVLKPMRRARMRSVAVTE